MQTAETTYTIHPTGSKIIGCLHPFDNAQGTANEKVSNFGDFENLSLQNLCVSVAKKRIGDFRLVLIATGVNIQHILSERINF